MAIQQLQQLLATSHNITLQIPYPPASYGPMNGSPSPAFKLDSSDCGVTALSTQPPNCLLSFSCLFPTLKHSILFYLSSCILSPFYNLFYLLSCLFFLFFLFFLLFLFSLFLCIFSNQNCLSSPPILTNWAFRTKKTFFDELEQN